MKPNQRVPLQSSTIVHGGSGNSVPVQSQSPWPKMTQADFQKYNKVFVAVDTDKDEKITGEQARNLFLSWRLPRGLIVCGSLWVSINGRESERERMISMGEVEGMVMEESNALCSRGIIAEKQGRGLGFRKLLELMEDWRLDCWRPGAVV
nr:epidermal growth factor receptor substrate 15-like 1 [Ipomoea batatas]